jgi:3'(2'), 5'-bisphosphate nucleotidase
MCSDDATAHLLARQAGQLLLALRARARRAGLAAERLGHEGDRRANDFLLARLGDLYPDDAVLSEESADDPRRLVARRVWIIDPLDGTREFAEPGRSDWAVHVALVDDGVLRVGAVALPARGFTCSTRDPRSPIARVDGSPRVLVSRTRPAAEAELVAAAVGGQLQPMGSAGAKTVAVIVGDADVYIHSGGQHEWDLAAPAAVALAAGLHVSRLDGTPLRFNQPEPWLPDVLICRVDLAGPILTALAVTGHIRTSRAP